MNIYVSSGYATRNEIAEMSGVQNWIISHANSSPIIGQVDDSVVGSFELTRSNVRLDKYHAMLIFAHSSYLPEFENREFTGRDMVSKLLEETPISYSANATYYNADYAGIVGYDPTETKVVISRGKHISGVIDKKAIGKGATGGIYHIINNEYGPDQCLEVMHNHQQIVNGYIFQFGFTIGIMDLIVSDDAQRKIYEIETGILNDSKLITEKLNAGEIIPPIGKTVEDFYEEQQMSALRVLDDFAEPIFGSINTNANSLFKLVMSGSKGKPGNIYHMTSAIGPIIINGARPKQTFSHKRSIAYFRRFETTPESRGYVTNCYINGINNAEFFFGAMNARFDLISKALLTSVTGEQNRKSIKSLESIIVDNYRKCLKGQNIIQFLYGEDGVDPRYLERVKFPTIMINDAVFEEKYKWNGNPNSIFDNEYDQLLKDRNLYRKLFLQLESINAKELLTDLRFMPVNVQRIIDNVLNEFGTSKIDQKTIEHNVKMVADFTAITSYVHSNEIQERNKNNLPEHLTVSVTLFNMLVRSLLCSNGVLSKISTQMLEIILNRIKMQFIKSLIDYGTSVGIIAAQSFSGPLTQYMLDAHHRTTTGGTATSGMSKVKEILGAKSIEKLDEPSMLISLEPSIEKNKTKVQELANIIEEMYFKQFISLRQVFFEKFGSPIHPKYEHESIMIAEFLKINPLLKPPGDLVKWCIRIVINKTTLILKNMALETIITKLREIYPDLFIVYTPENSPDIIIRIYMRNQMFKNFVEENDIINFSDNDLFKTLIRGVPGIKTATVVKHISNSIATDGSISRDTDKFAIKTIGTNIMGVIKIIGVDPLRIQTDSVDETYKVLGIEAARQRIVSEIRGLGAGDTNYCHLTIYADEMTYTGKVTSIERSGLSTREVNNVFLRLGFSSPMQTLEEAGVNSMEDIISGITAPLFLGTTPKHGTSYNNFVMDRDFISNNTIKADDVLDLL